MIHFASLEMGPDLTRAYLWPMEKKGPTQIWPDTVRFFEPKEKRIEKLGILGWNFPDPEVADPTQP